VSYKAYFTLLMFLTEGVACALVILMLLTHTDPVLLSLCGFLAVIAAVISMSMHVLVRLEQIREEIRQRG